jgi:uncharacterized membrane protein
MVIPLFEETHIEKIYSVFFKEDFPPDLILVLIWLAASIAAIYLYFVNETPLRVVFALPVMLVIPGYCLITAIFPRNDDIDLIARIVLSIGLSIAIVPLIGLGLNFTPWGIRLDSIVISLTFFTLVTVIVSHYRRAMLPSEERFRMPFSEIAGAFRKEFLTKGDKKVDQILNAVLAIAILITIIIAVYVITVPREGEKFTEFFILGENRTVASYPAKIVQRQDYPMYVGVGNHEYSDIRYTIETWMLLTEFDNVTNSSRILAMDPNDRLTITLAHNETIIIPYNFSVKKSGYNRVEFLLFNESFPGPDVTGGDRVNASYRELHLEVIVQ